ncbi:MAG: NlpC/P60 family protein [Nannocystaceae bacterium]|nr:C40 family peptidase [Myxococcales bacterium]
MLNASTSRLLRAVGLALALVGCGDPSAQGRANTPPPIADAPAAPVEPQARCPEKEAAPKDLPGVRPEHLRLDYWLARSEALGDLDAPLLTSAQIAAHNRVMLPAAEVREGVLQGDRSPGRSDLFAAVDVEGLRHQLGRRFEFLSPRFSAGKYLNADGSRLPAEEIERYAEIPRFDAALHPELRIALDMIPIRCAPRLAGYYTKSLDLAFDRNLCTTSRPQEVVQVLARWSDTLLLARTSYALGWIAIDAALSPPVTPAQARNFLRGPHARVGEDLDIPLPEGSLTVPKGTLLPRTGDGRLLLATMDGIRSVAPPRSDAIEDTVRPLTRRALLREAFAYLDDPYGWGGHEGGRDCSRFLLDVFASFGVQLPRNSAEQAVAGSTVIELPADASEGQRLHMLDEANRRGVVLAHFPGHIMLYLGRDDRGRPMALHSFAEYIRPCPGRQPDAPEGELETLVTVGKVTVSDLELGRGSSRTAFIERIDRLAVFGR